MNSPSDGFNILIVEDNPSDQFLLEQMLLSSRLTIANLYSVSSISEAKDVLEKNRINLLLLDLSLPDSFGIDSIKNIRSLTQRIPVIVLTGLADSEIALEALKQNAQDYLVKGEFDNNLLAKSIEYSIERKKAEENIIASEEKYRQMFYQNPLPMWINDGENLKIIEVNNAALQKYGYHREEFLELTLDDIQLSEVHTSKNISGRFVKNLWKHKKNDDTIIIVEFTYYPIDYFGRKAMQAQVNDVTEQLRLESELALQRQQLVEAVLTAQENERKNIGRELHDNINQILTAVKLNLNLASKYSDDSSMLISKCEKNIGSAIEEIRKISKELILPGNLKELGIVNSIEDLLKSVLHPSGVKWNLVVKGLDTTLSEDHKLTLYRIVQEQLNNILKHAAATFVQLHLEMLASQVVLTIADDGKGFDVLKKREGIGLTNIINRAELFNGQVKIQSAPGKGCIIEVLLNSKISMQVTADSNHFVLST